MDNRNKDDMPGMQRKTKGAARVNAEGKKMDELKPCPFCGKDAACREKAHGHTGRGEFTTQYFVGCDECNVGFTHESRFRLKGSEVIFSVDGYKKAKESWNRRAEP